MIELVLRDLAKFRFPKSWRSLEQIRSDSHIEIQKKSRERERERDQENTKRIQGQEMNPTEPDEILNFSGFGWVCPGCHPADPAACVKQEKWCQYQGHLFPQKLVMSPQWLSMCPERLSGAECIVRW
jgi:hypothetical protein